MSPAVRWICEICGHEHVGPTPPDTCPVCGAGPEAFRRVEDAPAEAVSDFSGHLVVLGAGIAGVAAAEAARATAPRCRITLLNGEAAAPYQRLALTRLLAGTFPLSALPIHPPEWFAERRIEILAGRAAKLLPRSLQLEGGGELAFDRLVLATGALPNRPPLPGGELPGVQVCRSLADAQAILERAKPGARVVVVGGGVLGLEKAGALSGRGCRVRVLEMGPHLMGRQLDPGGGECLAGHLARLGVEVVAGVRVRRVAGGASAEAVELEDGRAFPADLVLFAAGVRPDAALAAEAGLLCGKLGVRVDDALATSRLDVWAAGDCAEHRERSYGLWTAALHQGTVAGTNAAGGAARFEGLQPAVRLKVLATDVVGIGPVQPEPADRVLCDRGEGTYRRLLVRSGRLAGAILVGDGYGADALGAAVASGREIGEASDVETLVERVAGPRPRPRG